jgi:diketogulonate reductase-like aldo/keto reductase
MQYRPFGPTGQSVSVMGMGTWYINAVGREEAIDALRTGLDSGINHIDSAEIYGDAEIVVDEAIKGRRNDVFLVSKVLPQHVSRAGTPTACERWLRGLGTDWLGCYLLHWCRHFPLDETIAAFVDLKREGKIRSRGVSNFDSDDLEETYSMAPRTGEKIACNQMLCHLKERAIEHAALPWCARHGVGVTAYSPFGHGDFPDSDDPGGRVLQEIAGAHGATQRQVALASLVRHLAVFAIPKVSNPAHATENAGAGDRVLTMNDIALIDHAFPSGPRLRTLPMI